MNTNTPTQTKIDVAVIISELGYIRQKIDEMCGSDKDRDKRLTKVERAVWAIGGVSSVALAILIPIAVAAIKRWVGL